jgi:A/G-specific adenine glycosylase
MKARPAPPPPLSRFAPALLAWYDRQRRDLPWRSQPSPYRTLVSELMLQQTVVSTVVPYFERFVARFPDLPALAAAREEEVLALWSGLGYYARGRNLHRAALEVCARRGGRLPGAEEELRALPGVGEYTAAAVAAIAFGQRTFPLDGNGARVMARLHGVAEPIDLPAVRARLRGQGQALVPAGRPGDFAQAVMELGALVCVPGPPRCLLCPVRRWCAAQAEGREQLIPVRSPRRARRVVRLGCAAIEQGGRVLLVRRPAGTLLGGTWTLPAMEAEAGEAPEAAARRALAALGLRAIGPLRAAGEIRHVFTHRDVTASVFRHAARGQPAAAQEHRWVDEGALGALALSSFTRKTLAVLKAAPVSAVAPARAQRRARMASPSTR